jgi:hypothetical protein
MEVTPGTEKSKSGILSTLSESASNEQKNILFFDPREHVATQTGVSVKTDAMLLGEGC